jgi:thioredoxin-like negative regulator of GroEL
MECHPPSKNAFLGMALDLIRAGRLDEAAGILDQRDKLDREPNAVVLAIRSVLARRLGHAAEAGALERQARGLDPAAAAWAIDRATSTGLGTDPAWTLAP